MSLPPLFDRLRLPAIGAPLFIVSCPELVIAQCKAGIVGAFPALNARPQGLLDEWLHRIDEELAAWDRDHPGAPPAAYAVNQRAPRPSGGPGGPLCGDTYQPRLQPAPEGGHGHLRKGEGADNLPPAGGPGG